MWVFLDKLKADVRGTSWCSAGCNEQICGLNEIVNWVPLLHQFLQRNN